MNTILQHPKFIEWLRGLRDPKALARVLARINAAKHGNFGDWKPLGDGVAEMRIDVGPGYRVYFMRKDKTVYLLLGAGNKSTQRQDIEQAKERAKEAVENMVDWTEFDAADYLTDPAVMAEYLAACLEDDNPDVFLSALADVARARGVGEIAKSAKLGRESLYKALAPGAHPRHETIRRVITALGLRLTIAPSDEGAVQR